MTLKELRKARHEDIFLAVISRQLSWEESENLVMRTEEYPYGIRVSEALKICIEEALLESQKPLTEENIKSLEEEIKQTITSHLEESFNTILLKKDEYYIDLSIMTELDSKYKIKCLVEFNQYYSKGEYSFEEDEGGSPYLDLELEPFQKFWKDYEEGKFN